MEDTYKRLRAIFDKTTLPPLAAGLAAGALSMSLLTPKAEVDDRTASKQMLAQPVGATLEGRSCYRARFVDFKDGTYKVLMPPDGGCTLTRPKEIAPPALSFYGRGCDLAHLHIEASLMQLTIPANADCRLYQGTARPMIDQNGNPSP